MSKDNNQDSSSKNKNNGGSFDTTKHFATASQAVHNMKSSDEFIKNVYEKNGMKMDSNVKNPLIVGKK